MDICGFVEKAIFKNDQRIGYDFIDPETDETCAVARKVNISEIGENTNVSRTMGYRFYDEAWVWAESRIRQSESHHIVIVDELGRLEAQNLGLMPALCDSLRQYPRHLIAAVRSDAINAIEHHLQPFDIVMSV